MINQKSKIFIFLFFICYLLFATFTSVFAIGPEGPLVPCGPGKSKTSCDFCDLLRLVENVINYALYYIAIPLVVIMVVYGGFVIMTAGDSSDKVQQGRKIFTAAVVGALIAIGAWLIIQEVLMLVSGQPFEPWKFYKPISCGTK